MKRKSIFIINIGLILLMTLLFAQNKKSFSLDKKNVNEQINAVSGVIGRVLWDSIQLSSL
jgi:hypothetical protein